MQFSFVQSVLRVLLMSKVPSQTDVCQTIETAISGASSVYYPGKLWLVVRCSSVYCIDMGNLVPGTANYTQDLLHWSQLSNQSSICSVEPGTPEDVGKVVSLRLCIPYNGNFTDLLWI